jgi:hypothetical protein
VNRRTQALPVACGLALVLVLPAGLAAQESLATARQLYASAEYSTALTMLTGLLAGNPPPQERQSIELYRIFCLFAVNNVEEANTALDSMILRDPLYRPTPDEVPRRLRPAFSEARRRLLPSIIEQKYAAAKEAFDNGDYKAASTGFTQTLMALSDPDIANEAQRRPLSDLRTLATGFNELTVRALTPPPAPVAAPVPALPTQPEPAGPPRIYDNHDADVTAPVIVRQVIPPFPGQVFAPRYGRLDVVIDENGAVESAAMVQAIDPRYNVMVMTAAKSWQYQPAKRGGTPVKYRKTIHITLSPRQQ